jgi:hypothetical protein
MSNQEKYRKALLRARQAINACATELVACVRELEEADEETTPIRAPSQTTLHAAKGLAERVGDILGGKKK